MLFICCSIREGTAMAPVPGSLGRGHAQEADAGHQVPEHVRGLQRVCLAAIGPHSSPSLLQARPTLLWGQPLQQIDELPVGSEHICPVRHAADKMLKIVVDLLKSLRPIKAGVLQITSACLLFT